MDEGARAFRQLLVDPCNAPMASPVYSGLGTGQFRRFRTLIAAEGNSVEGTYVFQLATNTRWQGSHIAGTAGSNYTYSSGSAIFTNGDIYAQQNMRCLAGCVKVRYTGSEASRSGSIALLTSPTPLGFPGGTSSAESDMIKCPMVNRTGEVQHEVKFVPGQRDEAFTSPTVGGSIQVSLTHGVLAVVYRGTPAATLTFEVTGVYEMEASGGTITSVVPPSSVTLNQVLRSLGPITSWAYGHVVAPTLRAIAGKAQNTVYSAVSAAARTGVLMAL